jgi:hypothetical protein
VGVKPRTRSYWYSVWFFFGLTEEGKETLTQECPSIGLNPLHALSKIYLLLFCPVGVGLTSCLFIYFFH